MREFKPAFEVAKEFSENMPHENEPDLVRIEAARQKTMLYVLLDIRELLADQNRLLEDEDEGE